MLRRPQRDIDLRPELSTHDYRKEFPARFQDMMDARRWGPGERIVFVPYTTAVCAHVLQRISDRGIFPEGEMGSGTYEGSIISVAAESKRPSPSPVGAGQGEGTIMEEGEHR